MSKIAEFLTFEEAWNKCYNGALLSRTDDELLYEILYKMNIEDVFRDINDDSIFHNICFRGYKNSLKYILSFKDININKRCVNGMTGLHMAVQHDQEDVFKLLLKDGRIDASITTIEGDTALDLARKYRPSMVSRLEEYIK